MNPDKYASTFASTFAPKQNRNISVNQCSSVFISVHQCSSVVKNPEPTKTSRPLRFIEEHEVVDEFEMAETEGNKALNVSLKKGFKDAKAGRGRFV